jgi:hypothetical protein
VNTALGILLPSKQLMKQGLLIVKASFAVTRTISVLVLAYV